MESREKNTLIYNTDIKDVRYNASPREDINITLNRIIKSEVIEYDYVLKQVSFLAGKVAITELAEDNEHQDITFLSNEAEIAREKIEHLVVAHRLSAMSKLNAEFFYGLLRKNTLLKNNSLKSFRARFSINLSSDIRTLLYDVSLTQAETIKEECFFRSNLGPLLVKTSMRSRKW